MTKLENEDQKEYIVYFLDKYIILNQSQSENKIFLPYICGIFTKIF
jgi:hypothetical protein